MIMQLACDVTVAATYKSSAQRARVISEYWFERNSYCLACGSDLLSRCGANNQATDFTCPRCQHGYELKTFTKRPPKRLVDGAYESLMSRMTSGSAPTLCLLERDEMWQIRSLSAIHSSFLVPAMIEKRVPLSSTARRAGWVGCNIRLDRLAPDGEVSIIKAGVIQPREQVRSHFSTFLPLARLSLGTRGWTALTLRVIRNFPTSRFCLADVYAQERVFRNIFPENRHVREKLRQQLQLLRDLKVLTFEGKGVYKIIDGWS